MESAILPVLEAPPPKGGRSEPGRDGDWWMTWQTIAVYCLTCRHTRQDRPTVRRYRKGMDLDGIQARLCPKWPACGWLVWWECAYCDSTDMTQAVGEKQVAEWSQRLGPWYRG
jgi:hypothetical protein